VSGQGGADDSRSRVIAATDIVELIGQTVSLKKRGRDFVGLCPFHQEKTPSFHVSPARQFFHCYGCKAGGTAIDFVMKRDRVEFLDALRTLAARANIELPRYGVSKEKTSERQQLLDANSAACAFFEKLLQHTEIGKPAREYLQQRGINRDSIKQFQIGFAPMGWDGLLKSEVARKFPLPVLAKAGLAKEKSDDRGNVVSHYDTFRNRLMFPIRDEGSRIIAFGGRVMPGSEDPAKYLNSPETPLFSKSRSIFGLDLARQRIVETRSVAVVEGYTDVVMAHQFGVSNVVSVLGTALTEQHVGILRRFADRIVLLFDADVAGDAAVERAVSLFMTQPIDIAIATMPPDVDPDEFLLKEGAEALEKVFSEASDVLTFKWKQLDRKFNHGANGLSDRQSVVNEYLKTFASARELALRGELGGKIDPLRWGFMLTRLSRLIEIPTAELNRMFDIRKTAAESAKKTQVEPGDVAPVQRRLLTAQDRAERNILGVLLIEPARWHDVQQRVQVQEFTNETRRQLAELYWQVQQDEGEPVFSQFLAQVTDPALTELAIELVEETEELPDVETAFADATHFLADARRLREEQKLTAQLCRTDEKLAEQDEIALLKGLQKFVPTGTAQPRIR